MLPKYKYLLTYRFAEVIYDLTVEFCEGFLLAKPVAHLSSPGKKSRLPMRRTVEQMIQAARSGKQNIVEGVSQQTSLKSQIKLLGVAAASFEELIADYEDFLRQRKLPLWEKDNPRVREYRHLGAEATKLNSPRLLRLPRKPVEAANLLLTLCHQETYLLSRQIASLEEKFISEGGYTENLFRKRLNFRRSPKPPR